MREHVVRAEPLTSAGFAPFGQVIGADEVRLELREDESFHLDVLSYDHQPLEFTVLNRHHRATQALVALNGKPTVVLVAPRRRRLLRPGPPRHAAGLPLRRERGRQPRPRHLARRALSR